jgi:hypothetical protein
MQMNKGKGTNDLKILPSLPRRCFKKAIVSKIKKK